MAYKNPVPDIDKSKSFVIKPVFRFEDFITKQEAAKGIAELVKQNNGEVPLTWVEFEN